MERPEDWELLGFFGQEPDRLDQEEAEFFGTVSFTLALDDGDSLTFSLNENYDDLAVELRRDGSKEIRLLAHDVQAVRLEKLHGVETLVAIFGAEPNQHEARLTLRPTVRLDWR